MSAADEVDLHHGDDERAAVGQGDRPMPVSMAGYASLHAEGSLAELERGFVRQPHRPGPAEEVEAVEAPGVDRDGPSEHVLGCRGRGRRVDSQVCQKQHERRRREPGLDDRALVRKREQHGPPRRRAPVDSPAPR